MIPVLVLTAVIFCVVQERQVAGQGVYRYYDFNATQQAMIVNEHNRQRAAEPAKDMQEMVWDPNLATMAKSWAGQCVADHSGRFTRRNKFGYDRVGEALWWSDEVVLRDDLASIVQSFCEEKSYYYFESRACQAGKVCGHYTQVVWAQTCAVGCAAAHCAKLIDGGKAYAGQIVVCNYGPTGNIRGHDPYSYGKQCEACPLTCTATKLCPSSCSGFAAVVAPPPPPPPVPPPPPPPPPVPPPPPPVPPPPPTVPPPPPTVPPPPPTVPPPAVRETTSTTTMMATRQPSASGSSVVNPKCVDKNRLCSFWAKLILCEGRAWLNENCYGSCNRQECGSAVATAVDDCTDQDDSCAHWASSGACTSNAYFMNWKCPRSCNQCQSG